MLSVLLSSNYVNFEWCRMAAQEHWWKIYLHYATLLTVTDCQPLDAKLSQWAWDKWWKEKNNKLKDNHIELLNNIGFWWVAQQHSVLGYNSLQLKPHLMEIAQVWYTGFRTREDRCWDTCQANNVASVNPTYNVCWIIGREYVGARLWIPPFLLSPIKSVITFGWWIDYLSTRYDTE